MPQPHGGASFAEEEFGLFEFQLFAAPDLDRDQTIQFGITGFPNAAEVSGSQFFEQLKAPDLARLAKR